MTIFTLTPGTDTFTGTAGEDNFFDFTSADLQSTDTITGGATGSFIDVLRITAAGTIASSQFSGVTNVEELLLSSGGNVVTLTNGLVAGTATSNNFVVFDGAGNDTVDASGINNGVSVSIFSSGGTDIFKGGTGNDAFVVAAADLAADTIQGGTGVDNLYLNTAGTVAAAAFTNVTGIEGLVLANGTNNVTLTNALVASSNNGVFAVAGGTGDDTVDASGINNGIPIAFFSNGGSDTFKGGTGNDAVVIAASDLTAATILGGLGVDTLSLSTAGTVAGSAFANVTGIEGPVLANGTNNVTLTAGLVNSSNNGVFAVADGTGDDTVDASGIGNTSAIAFYSSGGNDTFRGGNGSNAFVFTAAGLPRLRRFTIQN